MISIVSIHHQYCHYDPNYHYWYHKHHHHSSYRLYRWIASTDKKVTKSFFYISKSRFNFLISPNFTFLFSVRLDNIISIIPSSPPPPFLPCLLSPRPLPPFPPLCLLSLPPFLTFLGEVWDPMTRSLSHLMGGAGGFLFGPDMCVPSSAHLDFFLILFHIFPIYLLGKWGENRPGKALAL